MTAAEVTHQPHHSAATATLDAWEGVWLFDSDASEYGDQAPPADAAYTLLTEQMDDRLGVRFVVRWRLPDADWQALSFWVPLDGDPLAVDEHTSVIGHLTGDSLVTEVLREGAVLQSAARHLRQDDQGELMQVVQRTPMQDGSLVETTAVYRRSRVKQVMCYRRDLKMRKGKIAAQCAHAAMAVFFQRDQGNNLQLEIPVDGPMAWWSRRGFAKVVLSVDDEEALLAVSQAAKNAGLPNALITDSGRTEFGGVPTRTTVAIGPAPVAWIDRITGRDGLVVTKLA
ncbi:MAG: aminoacyl-tRNA hydrolase [Myxococcales bacterium]|nr:aminoacyl-tRNA hydrolase [Myxococcales bacterium]